MRVLVCGSRDWHRDDLIAIELAKLPRGTTIMHGGCRGADRMADTIAGKLGFNVEEYRADWQSLGRSAGVRRNLAMLDEQPDLVIAFHKDGSTGTAHVIGEAARRGIDLLVVSA